MKRWTLLVLIPYVVTTQVKVGKCLRYTANDITGCDEREASQTIYRIGNDLTFTDQEMAEDMAAALNAQHEKRNTSDTTGTPPSDEPKIYDNGL